MRIGLDEICLFGVFIAFTLFLIQVVEGMVAKLFFVYWLLSCLACAVYILATRDKEIKVEGAVK